MEYQLYSFKFSFVILTLSYSIRLISKTVDTDAHNLLDHVATEASRMNCGWTGTSAADLLHTHLRTIDVVVITIAPWTCGPNSLPVLCTNVRAHIKLSSCEDDVDVRAIEFDAGDSEIASSGRRLTTSLSNDPRLNDQWSIPKIDTEGALSIFEGIADTSQALEQVLVGVIDSGVRLDHADIPLWVNPGEIAGNGVDDDGNGYVDDVNGFNFSGEGPESDPTDLNGHGTHCAGIIAAKSNNGIGIASPGNLVSGRRSNGDSKVLIVACKFLTSTGGGSLSAALACVEYMLVNRVRISNNSWGCLGAQCRSSAMEQAILKAGTLGHLFIAAAGNESNDNDRQHPSYPCDYVSSTVLCVCASDVNDKIASFSNTGEQAVDMCAPGVDILSTYVGPDYEYLSGTSMATPYVASAAAMLQVMMPNGSKLRASQLRWLLTSGVSTSSEFSGKVASGGVLNIGTSMRMLQSYDFAPVPPKIATFNQPFVCVPDTSGDDECSLVSITHIGDGWWRVSRWSDRSYSSKETAEFSFLSPATIEFEKMSIETSNSKCIYDGLALSNELFCSASMDSLGNRKDLTFTGDHYLRGAWYTDDSANSQGFSFKYKYTGVAPPTPAPKSNGLRWSLKVIVSSKKNRGVNRMFRAFRRYILDNRIQKRMKPFDFLSTCWGIDLPTFTYVDAGFLQSKKHFTCDGGEKMCAFIGVCKVSDRKCNGAWKARVEEIVSRRLLAQDDDDMFTAAAGKTELLVNFVLASGDPAIPLEGTLTVGTSDYEVRSCFNKLNIHVDGIFKKDQLEVDTLSFEDNPTQISLVRSSKHFWPTESIAPFQVTKQPSFCNLMFYLGWTLLYILL